MQSIPISTVGALIFNHEGEVLMIRTHKWSNLWGIPGGKIKLNESAEDALRREVREETGLEIRGIRFAIVQDCIGSREFFKEAHFVLLNYTCVCDGGIVTLNDEAEEYEWIKPGEALEKLTLNTPTRFLIDSTKGTVWT